MGYLLSKLGNLPIDDEIDFYIFVINGRWRESLYELIEQNFSNIAKNIGQRAVIAKGFEPVAWSDEIARTYLGKDHRDYATLLPALLITNSHPSKISKDHLRLLVPLRDVENRFGGWPEFFTLLADFVQFRSDDFLKRFDRRKDSLHAINRVIKLQPGAFGIRLDMNEIISWWLNRRERTRHAR